MGVARRNTSSRARRVGERVRRQDAARARDARIDPVELAGAAPRSGDLLGDPGRLEPLLARTAARRGRRCAAARAAGSPDGSCRVAGISPPSFVQSPNRASLARSAQPPMDASVVVAPEDRLARGGATAGFCAGRDASIRRTSSRLLIVRLRDTWRSGISAVAEEAELEVARGGDAHPVARVAEARRVRRDEPRLPRVPGVAVDRSPARRSRPRASRVQPRASSFAADLVRAHVVLAEERRVLAASA